MITSSSNLQIKKIIQLNQKTKARRELGLFVAEGRKMFHEAPYDWIQKVYVAMSQTEDTELMERAERFPCEVVSDQVFRQMSDTMTPQGILTVLRKPVYTLDAVLQEPEPLIVVLENLQDPGNVGTIFRTAEGAGVSGILLTQNSVDITNPKVIRSTMGSVYRMPYVYVENVECLREEFSSHGIRTYAAHLCGKQSYDREDYRRGSAFLIGNEGNGLTKEAAEMADSLIRIPMDGQVESLNAAMAAGILMFEAARQRRRDCGWNR